MVPQMAATHKSNGQRAAPQKQQQTRVDRQHADGGPAPQSLLSDPNAASPANSEAAKLYADNR